MLLGSLTPTIVEQVRLDVIYVTGQFKDLGPVFSFEVYLRQVS